MSGVVLASRQRAASCLVVFLAISLFGCGTDEAAERKAAAKREAAALVQKRAAQKRQAAREAAEAAEACATIMSPLVDALRELDSRLGVGLSYARYGDELGDARVVYDRVDADEVDNLGDCLTDVGVPAEKAFNEYVKAANTWGKCFDDFDCSNDSIRPALQRRWSRASDKVDEAKRGLGEMEAAATTP